MSFTEDELKPFYPSQKRKERAILCESKVNKLILNDQVCGYLNPIVHKLNKGLCINPQSSEHKLLIELLTIANV